MPAAVLAERVGADPLAIDRFLAAGAELGLLVRDGERFRNSEASARYLVRDTPTYLGDALERYDRLTHSDAWADFEHRLLAWRAGGTQARVSREGAAIGAERDGEHRLALLTGEALANTLDLAGRSSLLDLGGGTGATSIALCRRHPSLRAIVVELPDV